MQANKLLDTIIYLVSGVGIIQFIGVIIMFFVRYYFGRIQRDIDDIRTDVDKLWEAHNECDIDKISERTTTNTRDIERIEERINAKFNGKS